MRLIDTPDADYISKEGYIFIIISSVKYRSFNIDKYIGKFFVNLRTTE